MISGAAIAAELASAGDPARRRRERAYRDCPDGCVRMGLVVSLRSLGALVGTGLRCLCRGAAEGQLARRRRAVAAADHSGSCYACTLNSRVKLRIRSRSLFPLPDRVLVLFTILSRASSIVMPLREIEVSGDGARH